MAEDGASAGVQQKLLRHAPMANTHSHSIGSKPNGKANAKVVRQSSANGKSRVGVSADAS
jgi:hypothetical protein